MNIQDHDQIYFSNVIKLSSDFISLEISTAIDLLVINDSSDSTGIKRENSSSCLFSYYRASKAQFLKCIIDLLLQRV